MEQGWQGEPVQAVGLVGSVLLFWLVCQVDWTLKCFKVDVKMRYRD